MFRAFDKKTGAIVWEMELPAGVSNTPMTYMVNGKQFIVVAAVGTDVPGRARCAGTAVSRRPAASDSDASDSVASGFSRTRMTRCATSPPRWH